MPQQSVKRHSKLTKNLEGSLEKQGQASTARKTMQNNFPRKGPKFRRQAVQLVVLQTIR
jgi:hypothetical protein